MPTGYLLENVKDKTVLKTSMLMEGWCKNVS